MLTIRTTTLLATIATTQAVDYFKASCTKVEAGTVFIDQFGNGKKTVVGPANNCLIVGSSIIKCTGCGSSADCKIYDHTANAPCTVASADQSAKSMITCDESIPGTAINLQKFVDDDDCSGTSIAIGDNAGDLRWPWGTAPGYISSTGCNLLGNVANSDPMAYNVGKYVCNADGSVTLGQHANRMLCTAPVLPANRDATIPFSLPSDGGCYTLGAAETAVAALAISKNKICKVPADFNQKNCYLSDPDAVTTKTKTGGALAGLSIGSPDTCSALSTAASTELTDLAKTCCNLNSGAAESFCAADVLAPAPALTAPAPSNLEKDSSATSVAVAFGAIVAVACSVFAM